MHKNYSYKIIEQSKQNILTLEDIKNYTRISVDNDDNLLNSIANAAIQIAENFIKISLLRKVIEVESDNAMNVRLPFVPVVDIIKVDADGDEIDTNNITVNEEILTFTKYVECKQLKITYVAGYDDPSLVPAPIVQGIMQHISSMYDARGVGVGSLDGVLALYMPYRRMVI
jgi:hypothetical protein